jgi:hypothetical protein
MVSIAVWMYGSILVPSTAFDLIDATDAKLSQPFKGFFLAALCLSVAIEALLLWCAAKGFNWARYALALVMLAVAAGYWGLGDSALDFSTYASQDHLHLMGAIVQLACVALLFGKAAAPWFRPAAARSSAA